MRNQETQNEAMRIWKMIEPKISEKIKQDTKSCVRMKKLVVVTPPNGITLGVMQPNDNTNTIFNIPYVASLSNAQVGQCVFVIYWYGMTNAIAVALANNSPQYQSLLVMDVNGMVINNLQAYTMDNFEF